MIKREELIAAALEEEGTPFHHQGRAAKTGVDCIGLFVVALERCGTMVKVPHDYKRKPDGRLLKIMRSLSFLNEIDKDTAINGDLLVFTEPRSGEAWHVGMKTDKGMIHARVPCGNRKTGTVKNQKMTERWAKHLCSAFAIEGVK